MEWVVLIKKFISDLRLCHVAQDASATAGQRSAPPSDLSSYREAFEFAIEFTQSLDCHVVLPSWQAVPILPMKTDVVIGALHAAGVRDLRKSALQCLKWSAYLGPYLQDALGCRVWLTIGELRKNNRVVFGATREDLKRWRYTGLTADDCSSSGFKMHAWLTLPTAEIIDLTFFSTLAQVHPDTMGELASQIICGSPETILKDHTYIPIVVGEEYARKVNVHSSAQLLAANIQELESYSAMLMLDRH